MRLEKVHELEERSPHFSLYGFGDQAEIAAEQLVVPGQDLVDEDVAVSRQSAVAGRDPDA